MGQLQPLGKLECALKQGRGEAMNEVSTILLLLIVLVWLYTSNRWQAFWTVVKS
ncbi:MAG: hypothetical protein K6T26_07520 [Alicyclobacillus sp.]|nr:hypothetical protein [Alicyclobacillus sp.]